jgi:CBS domain-containing protein
MVYRGHGEPIALSFEVDRPEPVAKLPTVADRIALRAITSRDVICAHGDLALAAMLRLMVEHRIGCLPVVDDRRRPIGVVTKLDIIERLEGWMVALAEDDALPGDLAMVTASDIMMPLVVTVDEHATIAHAAAMMCLEDLHHVLVTSEAGVLVGIVSSKDLVDWIARNDGLSHDVRFPSGTIPPTVRR